MQTLKKDTQYVAEWGHYQIRVDTRGEFAAARIYDRSATVREEERTILMAELPRRTAEQAVEWAGTWLEEHRCKAFVDGLKRRVADFLRFEPDVAS